MKLTLDDMQTFHLFTNSIFMEDQIVGTRQNKLFLIYCTEKKEKWVERLSTDYKMLSHNYEIGGPNIEQQLDEHKKRCNFLDYREISREEMDSIVFPSML